MMFADRADPGTWRAVKCSISLRKTGSSTSLFMFVGLRRPLAFGLPVPLRVQFYDWIREHSAFSICITAPIFALSQAHLEGDNGHMSPARKVAASHK